MLLLCSQWNVTGICCQNAFSPAEHSTRNASAGAGMGSVAPNINISIQSASDLFPLSSNTAVGLQHVRRQELVMFLG